MKNMDIMFFIPPLGLALDRKNAVPSTMSRP